MGIARRIRRRARAPFALLLAVACAGPAAAPRGQTGAPPGEETPLPAAFQIDPQSAAERLGEAVRLRTLSVPDPARTPLPEIAVPERAVPRGAVAEKVNRAPFLALHALVEQQFPRVHATLEREVVNDLSLLYTWRGRDPEARPVLFASHMDVVPVDPQDLEAWTHGPWSGAVAEGFVWGRGTLDHKVGMMALLEATEALLAAGYQPERTLLLAFGHDEEVGGERGAAAIVDRLRARYAARLDAGRRLARHRRPRARRLRTGGADRHRREGLPDPPARSLRPRGPHELSARRHRGEPARPRPASPRRAADAASPHPARGRDVRGARAPRERHQRLLRAIPRTRKGREIQRLPKARRQLPLHPVPLRPDDVRRVHGIDERLDIDAYARAIRFYASTLPRAGSP